MVHGNQFFTTTCLESKAQHYTASEVLMCPYVELGRIHVTTAESLFVESGMRTVRNDGLKAQASSLQRNLLHWTKAPNYPRVG